MGDDGNDYSTGYVKDGESVMFQVWSSDRGFHSELIGEPIVGFTDLGLNMLSSMEAKLLIPDKFALENAYPNPFNPSTALEFDIPEDSRVSLKIYNINGRFIEELVNQDMQAGYHKVVWNASDKSSGAYFVKFQAGSFVKTQKIMLIK